MSSIIDLDHNATTCPFPEVVELMAREMRESYGNPGSRHAIGRKARRVLEDSREVIAGLIGAEPDEVVLTSGSTESINHAILGVVNRQPKGTIVLPEGEHPATEQVCLRLQQLGWKIHRLQVDSNGLLRADLFEQIPWDEARLVTVLLAHNETGVIQDLTLLSEMCRQQRVPLHVDATQAVGKIPVNFRELGATMMSYAAHKFHGPRGIGALITQKGVRVTPLMAGGFQEQEQRPGTELVALAAGMAEALRICCKDMHSRTTQVTRLRDQLEAGLQESCVPITINGVSAPRLPNTTNAAFPGVEGEALFVGLDLAGVACSLGSACASGSIEPSPILLAMGCEPEIYNSSVRFSVGIDNSDQEISEAIQRICQVVGQLRSGN